ncbi:MAG: dTDP-4-dehydrorhamnose reductase [Bacteroidota bacterium]
MPVKNILVTGANGQLGNECQTLAKNFTDTNFIFTDVAELSITDQSAIESIFSKNNFDYCINAAAYTAVDAAENNFDAANTINAYAVGYLAAACKKYHCRLIHISTDYVFDGENDKGYNVDDQTSPVNVYGATKLTGEKLALEWNPNSIVIRTSWVYSFHGKNFVKTMMKLMQEKSEISVVADQIGKPTYAADLADAIFKIIFSGKTFEPGIYHYANQGIISWHEFALAIKEIGGYSCVVNPIPSSAYPVPAKRPHYSILLTDKIEHTFGIQIPNWKDSLQKCMMLFQ